MIEITDAPAKEENDDKVTTPEFFMTDIMKKLSELENNIWEPINKQDKIKMQNIIICIKSELMSIDTQNKDIITVDGLKYRRVWE